MDGRLAFGALLAVPALYGLLVWATGALGPLGGMALGLLAYWAGLALTLGLVSDRDTLWQLSEARLPPLSVTLALALPVVVLGALALRALGTVLIPAHLIVAAALGAIVHAVLEELFWRGAMLPRPTPAASAGALLVFWVFHIAWLGARGLETGLDPLLLALGPLALGGAWTAARLATGTLGAAILGHAATALFLAVLVLAQGAPPLP